MAISVGKLSLYCVGAGIHPAQTLPISLDVGTDNQSLLDDPLYLGWREKRLRGDEYDSLVDEFVTAARKVFPKVVIQWEDFRKDNALRIMDRYREQTPSFNDDIQGTGAVALACVLATCKITGAALEDSRILIYGAGAAGLGIARQLRSQLQFDGLAGSDLRHAILLMDSKGVISDGRGEMDDYKRALSWPEDMAQELELSDIDRRELYKVVQSYRPTVLIGTSGQGGAFNEATVRAMADAVSTPVILPMSNPTSISEAEPEQILRWSEGHALIATGSPVSGASQITDGMIAVAAVALADSLTSTELSDGCLMPEITRLWDVSGEVGLAVANQAVMDGVAKKMSSDEMQARIDEYRWVPEYPEFI
jgi:malate dehydrogenase (oxaloacetate-decarboxylating)